MPNARVPAAAGGLPTRLAALAALASAGAALSLSAIAQAASSPDAVLLALFAEWQDCAAEVDQAVAAWFAAQDLFQRPEAPEALFRRNTDFRFFNGWNGTQHDGGRWWYGEAPSIAYLRRADCSPAEFAPEGFRAAFDARRDEILAASDAWQTEIEAAKRACGWAAAMEEEAHADMRNRALRRQIALTPAATVEGLLLKLQVAHWCCEEWSRSLEQRVAADDLTDETMIASAMRDLATVDREHERMAA